MKLILCGVLAVLGILATTPNAIAEASKPAFMQPEVLQAAVAINLTDAQKPQFQKAVTTFAEDRAAMFKKLLRKNNQANLARKVKSKTNSLLKKMDKTMAEFLTEEQMPAYKEYRSQLKSNLRGM